MPSAPIVVPTEFVECFTVRELVRGIAERLILGQSASAQILLFAADDEPVGIVMGAFYMRAIATSLKND